MWQSAYPFSKNALEMNLKLMIKLRINLKSTSPECKGSIPLSNIEILNNHKKDQLPNTVTPASSRLLCTNQ